VESTKHFRNVTSFKAIRACAEKRKDGTKALIELLPLVRGSKSLTKLGVDRVLTEMAKRVFCAGFVWSAIEAKWPDFEKAFLGFEPVTLTLK